MGCDIHLFIEHKEKHTNHWMIFGKRILGDRNYSIFASLCGVRGDEEIIKPVTQPRGLPSDVSWVVNDANTLIIDDELSEAEGYTTEEKAKYFVEKCHCQYTSHKKVTHPDWHNHSWATTEELKLALERSYHVSTEWKVILDTMESFEKYGEDVRIVFFFDN